MTLSVKNGKYKCIQSVQQASFCPQEEESTEHLERAGPKLFTRQNSPQCPLSFEFVRRDASRIPTFQFMAKSPAGQVVIKLVHFGNSSSKYFIPWLGERVKMMGSRDYLLYDWLSDKVHFCYNSHDL